MLFIERLQQNIFEHPDRIAVIDATQSVTYREFAELVNLYRSAAGTMQETVIAVSLPRSVEMVAASIAVISQGNTLLLLDYDLPPDRVETMMEKFHTGDLISDRPIGDRTPRGLREPDHSPWTIESQAATYGICTSGSTGEPKAIEIDQVALGAHLDWLIAEFGFTADDRLLMKTSASFDASTWELYLPLAAGFPLVVADPSIQLNPAELNRWLIDYKITILQLVPSVGRVVLDSITHRLRYLFYGGENLPVELADRSLRICDELVNLYGPAECTCNTIYYRYRGGATGKTMPMGGPVVGIEARVADDGELILVGPMVGGYVDPELDRERFFTEAGSRQRGYRTGDYVEMRDGLMWYRGRHDQQLKIRGQRVSTEELKAAAYSHPMVEQVELLVEEVEGVEGVEGSQRLVMLVRPELDTKILSRRLRRRLPKSFLPSLILSADEFPKRSGGKADPRALLRASREKFTYLDEQEAEMAKLASQMVGGHAVDPLRPLGELGLDSLSAIQLAGHFVFFGAYSATDLLRSSLRELKPIDPKSDRPDRRPAITDWLKRVVERKLVVIHASSIDLMIGRQTLPELIDRMARTHPETTFFVAGFNFSFCRFGYASHSDTRSETGVLADQLIDSYGWTTNFHPIYRWAASGPRANEWSSSTTCFGPGSWFEKFDLEDAQFLLLGCRHLTQIHYLEEYARVPYREFKTFEGVVETVDGKVEPVKTTMYVRNREENAELGFKYFDFLDPTTVTVVGSDAELHSITARQIRAAIYPRLCEDPNILRIS